jgi:hypothetical protein
MNAPLYPEVLRRLDETPQADLPLATEGVARYVWESKYGEMLIEVLAGVVYVNGDRIEPAMAEGGIAQALRQETHRSSIAVPE